MKLKHHNLLWVLGCVGVPVLLMSFQNCGGEFSLQEDVAYQQSLTDLQNNLDRKYLPSLLESSDLGYWNPDGSGDSIQKSPFLASSLSLVIVADRLATGSLLTVGSGVGSEEGIIFITSGKIRAIRRTSAVSYSYLEVALPTEGGKMVIAAGFGEAAGDISLLVNGIIQSGTPVVAGVPLDFSYLQKSVVSVPVGGKVYESMVYGLKLGNAELNVLSRYLASSNQLNNVFLDPSLGE